MSLDEITKEWSQGPVNAENSGRWGGGSKRENGGRDRDGTKRKWEHSVMEDRWQTRFKKRKSSIVSNATDQSRKTIIENWPLDLAKWLFSFSFWCFKIFIITCLRVRLLNAFVLSTEVFNVGTCVLLFWKNFSYNFIVFSSLPLSQIILSGILIIQMLNSLDWFFSFVFSPILYWCVWFYFKEICSTQLFNE